MRALTAFLLLAFGLCLLPQGAAAQSVNLTPLRSVRGSLLSAESEALWAFNARLGMPIAAQVQAVSGNLLPTLELYTAEGDLLARGALSSYATVTLQNMRAPREGRYILRVAAREGAGDYRLTLLNGYATLLLNDTMDGRTVFRTWLEPRRRVALNEGRLLAQVAINNGSAYTTATQLDPLRDFYLQTDLRIQSAGAWQAALLLRASEPNERLQGYALALNHLRQWRLVAFRAGVGEPLRDWQPLGVALPAVGTTFTVAVLLEGERFTFWVNGAEIATFSDATFNDAGQVGIWIGGAALPENFVSTLWDNVIITVPAAPASPTPILPPERLPNWNGSTAQITAALAEARLTAGQGVGVLRLPEAFVTNNTTGGILYTPLARGEVFSDLIFSADVVWESDNDAFACAVGFGATEGVAYSLVYFDQRGGVGVRQEGSGALLNFYDLREAANRQSGATNRLTVIAVGNGVIVYLNGDLVVHQALVQRSGSLYIAAFNYERASSLCRFRDVWLRRLSP
ncbi:hypothetical protein FBQ95_01655 [Chloroflexi bacterium CFX3]|nr:hypothetical protein [Chloroflexi bacterium CFX3]